MMTSEREHCSAMTQDEKNLILDLAMERLSEQDFLNRSSIDLHGDSAGLGQMLDDAQSRKDLAQLECILILFFRFGGEEKYTFPLCQLLGEDWHIQHENIVMLLQKIRDPSSVECLYRAAIAHFAYLDYDRRLRIGNKVNIRARCYWH